MLSHISNRPRVAYLALVTLISHYLRLSHIGRDVGQIFEQRANIGITPSCIPWYVERIIPHEIELSHMGKNNGYFRIWI